MGTSRAPYSQQGVRWLKIYGLNVVEGKAAAEDSAVFHEAWM